MSYKKFDHMIIAIKFRKKWDFQEGLTSPQTCAILNALTPSSLTKKSSTSCIAEKRETEVSGLVARSVLKQNYYDQELSSFSFPE